jgi:hypothetical protein
VVDEAHTIITDRDFRRDTMGRFSVVNQTGIPITLMTGTLPPRIASSIMHRCGVTGGPDTYNFIRVQTNRQEHLYAVLRPQTDLLTAVKSFVRRATEELEGTQRGVIFTRRKTDAQDLGEELEVGVVTADVKTDRERKAIMDNWKGGYGAGWIVGTKSLIQGVDYPNVRYVVFMETPFGMVDFIQGAGRGGRNGETCRVVVLNRSEARVEGDDLGSAREMNLWAQTTEDVCLRRSISEHMDGVIVTCASLAGAEQCHHCRQDSKIVELYSTHYKDDGGPLRSTRIHPFEEPVPTNVAPLDMPPLVPQHHRSTVVLGTATDLEQREKRTAAMKKCMQLLVLYHSKLPRSPNGRYSKCIACDELGFSNHTPKCLDRAGPLSNFYLFNKPGNANVGPSRVATTLVG